MVGIASNLSHMVALRPTLNISYFDFGVTCCVLSVTFLFSVGMISVKVQIGGGIIIQGWYLLKNH